MAIKIPPMTIDPLVPPVYEFGSYRLDPAARQLTRDGTPVPLFPKVLDTLIVLVESGGQVLSKEELVARIWPDTFVQESNLTQNIFLLRKILGDTAIETVPRRGYRFAAEVAVADEEIVVARRTSMRIVSEEVTDGGAPRTRWIVAASVAVIALAGVIAVQRFDRGQPAPVVAAPRMPSMVKLTHDSRAYDPAISPDGRFVAYKVRRDSEITVWLKELARGSATQIMPPGSDYRALTFSPDGHELFFKTYRDGETNALIMRVPILGGTPREVARNAWSDFSVSPDGAEVAFVRGSVKPDSVHEIVAARVDGRGERVVGRSVDGKSAFALWDSAPVWSPDGKRIAVCGWTQNAGNSRRALFEVDVASGATRELAIPESWAGVSQIAWLPDGTALVASATEAGARIAQLWLLEQPSGRARRITNDTTGYRKLKLSADGKLLVVEQQQLDHHVWVVPGGDTTRARQLTFGTNDTDGVSGLAWLRDRRVLLMSDRSGQRELWSMKADGSDARQLTTGSTASSSTPRPTPDGRHIVFASARSGRWNLWRIDADGRNPLQLTRGESEVQPSVSPDGEWVYFTNASRSPSRIERVAIDGGAREVLDTGTDSTSSPVVSPDGTMLAIEHYDDRLGWRNGIVPIAGGEKRLYAWHSNRGIVRWTPDSRALLYINDANLWRQPIDGGAPSQVTRFPGGPIWNFAPSADGRDLAVVRGDALSDIVLLRDFR
jgi:Tol biopolymer transport system component/DNA-binding winged helix-turn-helix (wHTH) protein